MKLMVLAPAVFSSEEDARKKLWIFLRSCEKYGVELHLYGMGTQHFPGYRALKLEMQLDYLKSKAGDYDHVLYSDDWDAFFTAPLTEIVAKYEAMGSPPILASAACQSWPREQGEVDTYDMSKVYRYPHVGGYIAEIPVITAAFERMLKLSRQAGDDCFNWFDAWQEGWFRPQVDSQCYIFQVGEGNCVVNENGQLYNTITKTRPCILHLPGGFCHQVTGKDRVMIPWATRLGVIE